MFGYYGEGKRWQHAHYKKLAAHDLLAIVKHGLETGLVLRLLEPGRDSGWKASYYDSIGDFDAAAYWYCNG